MFFEISGGKLTDADSIRSTHFCSFVSILNAVVKIVKISKNVWTAFVVQFDGRLLRPKQGIKVQTASILVIIMSNEIVKFVNLYLILKK